MGASAGEEHGTSAGGSRVLLVDDNRDVLESAADLLRGFGYDVKTTGDGRAALDLVESWRPRHVLIDMYMPLMNGFELARLLRERFSSAELRLILMSGVTINVALEESARSAGFDACIDKLAEPEEWLTLLRAG